MGAGSIHVGVGGWDYDPWRGAFYPEGLAKARQLEHLAGRLTAVEVNATFYKLQKPELFERWAAAVPDGFKFAIKASRYCTNRKALGEGAEAIGRFCAQGFTALGDKLGPILWQFAPTKRFDPDEMRDFLMLLPTRRDGIALRHALEVRHESFRCREFVAMARAANVAIAFADHETYPAIADLSADFVYARLQRSSAATPGNRHGPSTAGATDGVEARVPGLDERAGVLDVGVGMRPDLTGQGLGREFASAVLEHGRAVTGAGTLRAVVQDWNARGRALLERLGFQETGQHRVGEVRYVVYERRSSRPPSANRPGGEDVTV